MRQTSRLRRLGRCLRLGRNHPRLAPRKLARYLRTIGLRERDHACAQCLPASDVVIDGFVCGYHRALAILGEEEASR